MMESLSEWLTQTELSRFLSDTTQFSTWLIVPLSQTIHILGVAFVMISIAMLNLRLLGVAGGRQSFAQLTSQLTPWIWGALLVLLVTGVVQTIAEPGRELLNIGFQVKMVLLVGVVAITLFYSQTVKKDPGYWERSRERQRKAHMLAGLSLVAWVVIASAGRMIAYLDMRTEF
jgi:uncharacterized membrane protein